jgi:hypothetical protein
MACTNAMEKVTHTQRPPNLLAPSLSLYYFCCLPNFLPPAGIGYIAFAWMACTSAIEKVTPTGLSDPVCDRKHFRTMAEAFLREHPMAIFVQASGWLRGLGREGEGVRVEGGGGEGAAQFLIKHQNALFVQASGRLTASRLCAVTMLQWHCGSIP